MLSETEHEAKARLALLLPAELLTGMRRIAKAHRRTLTGELSIAMSEYLERNTPGSEGKKEAA
jgi:hypothetical protein